MKTLRSMSISRRLWLILLVAVAMLVVLGLLMLRQIHGDLYQAKAEKTRHVVQTAAGVLAGTHYVSASSSGADVEVAGDGGVHVVGEGNVLTYDTFNASVLALKNKDVDGVVINALDAIPCQGKSSATTLPAFP